VSWWFCIAVVQEYMKECLVSITVTVDTDALIGDGSVSYRSVTIGQVE